jgi:transcription-repair coupling factor (superfamily II helicase)
VERQLDELKGWLEQMAAQIPDPDGLTREQRDRQQKDRNEAVLTV